MFNVTSKIKIDQRMLDQLIDAEVEALEKTGEAIHTEVVQAQVVPRKDGALSGESFFVDTSESKNGEVSLVHAERYARRLYFHPEYNFKKGPWEDEKGRKHDGNPNAKGHWFEDWLPGGKDEKFAKETFIELYEFYSGLK